MWSNTYNERRLTRVEARAKSNTHRIDKLEPIVEEIHTMSETMVQLVEEVKHTNENVCALDEKIDSMDARVDVMERAPAEDVKKYKSVAVTERGWSLHVRSVSHILQTAQYLYVLFQALPVSKK